MLSWFRLLVRLPIAMLETPWLRLLCFVFIATPTLSASAAEFDVESLQKKMLATIKAVQPAVVAIRTRGGAFSGVIVSKEGHILSAGHAVRPGGRYQVFLPDGRRLRARGKGSNSLADCALLQITSDVEDLPFVQMGESRSLVRNQPCLSLSFPGGQGTREGPIVRFGRVIRSGGRRGLLQSSALMEPGDSGGPLFDLEGRVIGIHSRIGRSMERNYEVPIDTFKKFWNELNREQPFTQSGPPVPRLGFRGRDQRDGSGISIFQIVDGSLADEHGLKTGDILKSVYGKETPSIQVLREALIAARDEAAETIVVKVVRDEEDVELTVPFDVEREAAPKVELPKYADKEFPKPKAIEQLANLPRQFADLESNLDDVCVEVFSKPTEGEELSIVGTMIKATPFIVSKSSMVAENPVTKQNGSESKLEVVARDTENDLVLLKSSDTNTVGIDIGKPGGEVPGIGSFLITPDADGQGLVSIVSTKTFASRKQQSRGFLGVVPVDYKDKGGAMLEQVTEGGAAARAGLKVGDVVTKLNETEIQTQMDMRRFLGTVDPNATIVATLTRGEEELEKPVRLGAFPSFSNHVADRMDKSGRRDGFSKVIPHDADLKPNDCGSPIFDLDGNFVGLNIARNSRVRSYAIPSSVVKSLVEKK